MGQWLLPSVSTTCLCRLSSWSWFDQMLSLVRPLRGSTTCFRQTMQEDRPISGLLSDQLTMVTTIKYVNYWPLSHDEPCRRTFVLWCCHRVSSSQSSRLERRSQIGTWLSSLLSCHNVCHDAVSSQMLSVTTSSSSSHHSQLQMPLPSPSSTSSSSTSAAASAITTTHWCVILPSALHSKWS